MVSDALTEVGERMVTSIGMLFLSVNESYRNNINRLYAYSVSLIFRLKEMQEDSSLVLKNSFSDVRVQLHAINESISKMLFFIFLHRLFFG